MRRALPLPPSEATSIRRSWRFRWTVPALLTLGCQSCPSARPAGTVERVPHDPSVFQAGAIHGVRNGIAVGVGYYGVSPFPVVWRYSNQGRTWTLVWTGSFGDGGFYGVADLAGGWVALGGDPWLSDNGNTWTRHALPESPKQLWGMLRMVSASKIMIYGSVGDGAQFWVSSDRTTWTTAPEQASLGLHTPGHMESRFARHAEWDGTTIVAIGERTYFNASGLRTWGPLVWLSSDLGSTWQTITPPAASPYWGISLHRVFQWFGRWTIVGSGRTPTSGVTVPLAWTSSDGQTWTLQPSDQSVYTTNVVMPMFGDGVQALLRCNGGYAWGVGSLSDRATLWSYSNLGTWEKISTSAFDAEPKNALYAIDDCGDPHILVGWAQTGGVNVAAAWTYGSTP
jgi:hypothetical protein